MTAKGIFLLCLLLIQFAGRFGNDWFREQRDRTGDDEEAYRTNDIRQLVCVFVANGAAIMFVVVAMFAIVEECQ